MFNLFMIEMLLLFIRYIFLFLCTPSLLYLQWEIYCIFYQPSVTTDEIDKAVHWIAAFDYISWYSYWVSSQHFHYQTLLPVSCIPSMSPIFAHQHWCKMNSKASFSYFFPTWLPWLYQILFHIRYYYNGFNPFVCLNISVSMLRGMDLVLWSVLLAMELAEYFIQNQLYITSVSILVSTIICSHAENKGTIS